MAAAVRLVIAVLILVLLARSARLAWANRRLALAVWRRMRPVHVVGSLGLLVVVGAVALALIWFAPLTGVGLGSLIGLTGNAVFAPVEEAALRSGASSPIAGGAAPTNWAVTAATGGFLLVLLGLFPWLAYVEERRFRWGLEGAGLWRQVAVALRFGLLHLVMLIPLAAALAVGVAGFVYGRLYRRAYRRAAARAVVVSDSFGLPVVVEPPVSQVRSEAVLASTVWHATFNSLIVVLVMVGLLADAFA